MGMTINNEKFDLRIDDSTVEGEFDDLLGNIKDTTPEVSSLLWELRQLAETTDASTLNAFLQSIQSESPGCIAALIQACPIETLEEVAQIMDKASTQTFAVIAGQNYDLTYFDAQAVLYLFRDFRNVSKTIHSDSEKVEALLGNIKATTDENSELPPFEELKELSKPDIEKILKMVAHDALIVAFANGADEVCDAFTTVMNKRAANMLLEDIDDAKNIGPKLVTDARRAIQEVAKSLSVMGEIDLK